MGSTHNLFLLKVCRSAHIDYEEKKLDYWQEIAGFLWMKDCSEAVFFSNKVVQGSVGS